MFTLYSADFINAPSNCSYPHKTEVGMLRISLPPSAVTMCAPSI